MNDAVRDVMFSPTRVAAMVLRYWYLLRSSWSRLIELIYWPTVQMLMWGFLQTYLAGQSNNLARAGGVFIGAVMLWDILFRGQLGFSISFLEEMYARNLGNLMISPLRPFEFVAALMIMSIVRLAIGMLPVTLLAIWFFGFNLWGLGVALAAFFANLMLTGWAVGIFVSGLVLRNGLGCSAACLVAARCLGPAPYIRIRGDARAGDGAYVPCRPYDSSTWRECRAVRDGGRGLPRPPRFGPP
jgi:ABC-2 type transport system permease protein